MTDKLENKYYKYDAGSHNFKTVSYPNSADIRVVLIRDQVVDVILVGEYSLEREWYQLKHTTQGDE